jgi:AAA domain
MMGSDLHPLARLAILALGAKWVDGPRDGWRGRLGYPSSSLSTGMNDCGGGGGGVTSDHLDRDGIPLPTEPLEPAGGEVVDLHPVAARARCPTLPAAELAISSFGEVASRVAAAGEPRWLIQGLWPADAYGVLAAQEKAGKTWAALDLAVSVATGRPWLEHFACPTPGPVLMFLGEGGERTTVRRIEAIATSKGVDHPQLAERLRLCFRVPRLAAPGAGGELAAIQAELQAHPAALVVLDPLYLAAAGASGSNLYDMGAVLQAIQGVCQHAGCALLVVTHWNKTGDGRGADRISGAGPAAWARVICSVSIQHRGSDADGASTVLMGVELIGGEIPDTRFRMRRRVHADDATDLGSPLSYAVEVLAADDDEDLDPAAAELSPSRQWVLTALRAGGDMQTVKQLGDRLAEAGRPLKPRTIQTALAELEAAGLTRGSEEGNGRARYWSPVTSKIDDADGGGAGA